eukprot:g45725.t1
MLFRAGPQFFHKVLQVVLLLTPLGTILLCALYLAVVVPSQIRTAAKGTTIDLHSVSLIDCVQVGEHDTIVSLEVVSALAVPGSIGGNVSPSLIQFSVVLQTGGAQVIGTLKTQGKHARTGYDIYKDYTQLEIRAGKDSLLGLGRRAMEESIRWTLSSRLTISPVFMGAAPFTFRDIYYKKTIQLPALKEQVKFTVQHLSFKLDGNFRREPVPVSLQLSVNNTSIFAMPHVGDMKLDLALSLENGTFPFGFLAVQNASFVLGFQTYALSGACVFSNATVFNHLVSAIITQQSLLTVEVRPWFTSPRFQIINQAFEGLYLKWNFPISDLKL